MNTKPSTSPGSIRRRAEAIDRYVGTRLRRRRVMLCLTQKQMSDLIGITVPQVCKYETGTTRVTSGRLYQIAQALGVEVGYFFDGIGRDDASGEAQHQWLLLELSYNFNAIPIHRHQQEIVSLARALADTDEGRGP
jgi:transcriptional regulator with XRE-family HTH domain